MNEDLEQAVKAVFKAKWEERDGNVVPEPSALRLGNDAVKLDAVCLYADLAESTDLVNKKKAWFAAEIYKTFLHCASKIIVAEGGVITSFDGDRVMGIFIDGAKNTAAARCGLKINYAVGQIINPALKAQYPNDGYALKHAVGIDRSDIFAARTGVRGSNDIVWVGRAANYAAKLATLRDEGYATFITKSVYDKMWESMRVKESTGENRWEARSCSTLPGITIYRSSWRWKP